MNDRPEYIGTVAEAYRTMCESALRGGGRKRKRADVSIKAVSAKDVLKSKDLTASYLRLEKSLDRDERKRREDATGERRTDKATDKDMLQRLKGLSRIYFALDGVRAVGMLAEGSDADGGAFISSLVVDERSRGNGVGTALLKRAVGDLGGKGACLSVSASNTAARRLYEKAGFRTASLVMCLKPDSRRKTPKR